MKISTKSGAKTLYHILGAFLLFSVLLMSCTKNTEVETYSYLSIANASPTLATYNIYLDGIQSNAAFERFRIAPMLLIPFVENVFKHGIGTLDKPFIDVILSITEDSQVLHLMVRNDIAPQGFSAQESSSGIGLTNVRRRLELLYPGRHSFDIMQTAETFTVKLQIDL